MPKRSILAAILSLSLLGPVGGWAQLSDEQLSALLELSGTTEQTGQIGEVVVASLEQAQQQFPAVMTEPVVKELAAAAREAYDTDTLLREIEAHVRPAVSPDEARELFAWYRSDIGRTITAAEEAASTPEALAEMMAQADSLQANEALMDVARRVNEIIDGTDLAIDLQEASAVAMLSAVGAIQGLDVTPHVEAMKAQLRTPEARQQVEQFVLLNFAFSYREIAPASLASYLEFLESPPSTAFLESSGEGLMAALKAAAERFAASFAESLQRLRADAGDPQKLAAA